MFFDHAKDACFAAVAALSLACIGPSRHPEPTATTAPARAIAALAEVPRATSPARRPQSPRVAFPRRIVRGRLGTSPANTCHVDDPNGFPWSGVKYGGAAPVLALDRGEVTVPLRVWARSHGTIALVVEQGEPSEAETRCSEALPGEAVTLTVPERGGPVRVYVSTRAGESGPFVVGVTAAEEPLPGIDPEPLPPLAQGEVRTRWAFEARSDCPADPDTEEPVECRVPVLVFSGAPANAPRFAAPHLVHGRCTAEARTATPPASGASTLICNRGMVMDDGTTSLSVEPSRRGGFQITQTDCGLRDGNVHDPWVCRRRVLRRFTLPSGAWLTPDPRGVLDVEHQHGDG